MLTDCQTSNACVVPHRTLCTIRWSPTRICAPTILSSESSSSVKQIDKIHHPRFLGTTSPHIRGHLLQLRTARLCDRKEREKPVCGTVAHERERGRANVETTSKNSVCVYIRMVLCCIPAGSTWRIRYVLCGLYVWTSEYRGI